MVRSVGTSNFLSAAAFAIMDNQLALTASVTSLEPEADPVAALMQASAQH